MSTTAILFTCVIGGIVSITLTSFLRAPWQFYVLTFLFDGISYGYNASTIILVGEDTPPEKQGIVQGAMTSFKTLGMSFGAFAMSYYNKWIRNKTSE